VSERERWLVPLLVAAVVLVMLAVTAWVALRADGGDEPEAGRATPRPTTSTSVAPTSTAPVEVVVEAGTVPGRRFSTEEPATPPTSSAGPSVDDAVDSYVDAVGWVLTGESLKADPDVLGTTLPSLNFGDRGILERMPRDDDVVVDFTLGAYKVHAVSGDAAAPEQVMLDTLVVVTFGERTRWLKIGGVVVRTETGWTPSSVVPTEVGDPGDVTTPLAEMPPVQAQLVTGDAAPGWRSFAAAGR